MERARGSSSVFSIHPYPQALMSTLLCPPRKPSATSHRSPPREVNWWVWERGREKWFLSLPAPSTLWTTDWKMISHPTWRSHPRLHKGPSYTYKESEWCRIAKAQLIKMWLKKGSPPKVPICLPETIKMMTLQNLWGLSKSWTKHKQRNTSVFFYPFCSLTGKDSKIFRNKTNPW